MGNILRACFKGDDHGDDHYPYYRPTSRPPSYQPQYHYYGDADLPAAASLRPHQQPHGGVASLAQDLLNFESTSMVPAALGQNVTSSKKAQAKWYQNILEAYKNMRPPPKTPAEAALLIATALSRIQRHDLEAVLAFYNLPIPSLPAASASSDHPTSSLPEGVQFVLSTLPVHNKCIGDGDGFTAYVNTAEPRESGNVPLEVHEMVIKRTQARADRDYPTANALQRSLDEAGYKYSN